MARFVIARNPEADSRLPYLLWVPLGQRGVLFKAGGTWPRTSAVYCHDRWRRAAVPAATLAGMNGILSTRLLVLL